MPGTDVSAQRAVRGTDRSPDVDQHHKAARVRVLLDAADQHEVDAVSPMLSSGSDGHTPLLVAARDGNADAVAALLAAGADQTWTRPPSITTWPRCRHTRPPTVAMLR